MSDLREQLSPKEEFEREVLAASFREVFASDAGKRVMFWMLEQCAIYNDAFAGDNNVTNYTLGLQAAGRKLIAKIDDIDPRIYPKFLLDAADLREMDKAARAAQQRTEDHDVEA